MGWGVPEPSSCRGSQDRLQMPFQRQHALSQRACQLLSSQPQRPFTPSTLPHTTRHGPAGGDCHNASHRSRLTGEDRPGLTAGTAEGLWTSWVRLWSASPRMTPPPQAQTQPLAKKAQNRSGGSTGLGLLSGHCSAGSHTRLGLREGCGGHKCPEAGMTGAEVGPEVLHHHGPQWAHSNTCK